MNYKLSIIIPVFNKINFTISALDDLFKLTSDHQLIIVDNASTDQTQEKLSKIFQPNFTYIRLNKNIGFGGACNAGYNKADAPNIMFLNNDIRVQNNFSNWTDEIINYLEHNPNYLVGPTGGYIEPKNDFEFKYETNDPNKLINYVSGWCLTSTKQTFDQLILDGCLGPFDDKSFFLYFEDPDLAFRAKEKGINFKLISVPVKHFGKISSEKSQIHYHYNKSRQIFLNKWKNK